MRIPDWTTPSRSGGAGPRVEDAVLADEVVATASQAEAKREAQATGGARDGPAPVLPFSCGPARMGRGVWGRGCHCLGFRCDTEEKMPLLASFKSC